jgi:hypothetical protein
MLASLGKSELARHVQYLKAEPVFLLTDDPDYYKILRTIHPLPRMEPPHWHGGVPNEAGPARVESRRD